MFSVWDRWTSKLLWGCYNADKILPPLPQTPTTGLIVGSAHSSHNKRNERTANDRNVRLEIPLWQLNVVCMAMDDRSWWNRLTTMPILHHQNGFPWGGNRDIWETKYRIMSSLVWCRILPIRGLENGFKKTNKSTSIVVHSLWLMPFQLNGWTPTRRSIVHLVVSLSATRLADSIARGRNSYVHSTFPPTAR